MCKLSNNVKKYVELKSKIESLKEELDKLSGVIIDQMSKEDVKSSEDKEGNKLCLVSSTKVSYNDNVVEVLKQKAPVCVVETYDNDKVKSCLKAGILNEEDLSAYAKVVNSKFLKLYKK